MVFCGRVGPWREVLYYTTKVKVCVRGATESTNSIIAVCSKALCHHINCTCYYFKICDVHYRHAYVVTFHMLHPCARAAIQIYNAY